MDAILELRRVGGIEGNFFIPSFQRGYRWRDKEVKRLLDDIYQNKNANYCLQPIVVRKDGDVFRVIDGQQRLTTIYLIYKYLNVDSKGYIEPPAFSISYETRPGSQAFLESNVDEMMENAEKNVDYWFMANSYRAINEWFNDEKKGKKSVLTGDINKLLEESVNVIWYEIGPEEDERELFTRLNIGKIPLTSAELVKAMFLSRTNSHDITREKQEEIALQWDNIEKELHDKSLWYFLTNALETEYQTHIDLVLDLESGKSQSSEEYHTFFYFDKRREEESLEEIWQSIYHTFSLFKDWHDDHTLYHKIGYLISAGVESLASIFKSSINQTKQQFRQSLDDKIKKSVSFDCEFEELSYEDDYDLIHHLLLLFNVESVCKNGEQTQWFPFDKYKQQQWSLEHIHARHSDLSRRQELWLEWLQLHLHSLRSLIRPDHKDERIEDLISEVETCIENGAVDSRRFEDLQNSIIDVLSDDSDGEYVHTIANMALLNTANNSALNNAAFDVKRNRIIKMDQEGKFIPFCTKMVFLKYYSPSNEAQMHFWSESDRQHYVGHIKKVLANYLPGREPKW